MFGGAVAVGVRMSRVVTRVTRSSRARGLSRPRLAPTPRRRYETRQARDDVRWRWHARYLEVDVVEQHHEVDNYEGVVAAIGRFVEDAKAGVENFKRVIQNCKRVKFW